MIFLGFGHRARQGKTVCCDAILEYCSYHNLVQGVYDFGAEVLAFCQEQGLIRPEAVRAFLSATELEILQREGLAQRQADAQFWIGRLAARLEKKRPAVALIPNLRFPNEAEFVKARGGHCILVRRFNADGSPHIAADRDPNHPSETALGHWAWDFRLAARSGEGAWLRRQAVAMLEHLR